MATSRPEISVSPIAHLDSSGAKMRPGKRFTKDEGFEWTVCMIKAFARHKDLECDEDCDR